MIDTGFPLLNAVFSFCSLIGIVVTIFLSVSYLINLSRENNKIGNIIYITWVWCMRLCCSLLVLYPWGSIIYRHGWHTDLKDLSSGLMDTIYGAICVYIILVIFDPYVGNYM